MRTHVSGKRSVRERRRLWMQVFSNGTSRRIGILEDDGETLVSVGLEGFGSESIPRILVSCIRSVLLFDELVVGVDIHGVISEY